MLSTLYTLGRPFLHDRLVVVASPALTPSAEAPVPAVVRGADPTASWKVMTFSGSTTIAIDPILRLSSLIMIRDAVRAGAGRPACQCRWSAAISQAAGLHIGATWKGPTSLSGRSTPRAGSSVCGFPPSSIS